MPNRMPENMPDAMSDRMPEDMPEDLPEYMPEHMPEDMLDRMPDRMPKDMSDRMPEDLPVRKCINVMVRITWSKVAMLRVYFGETTYWVVLDYISLIAYGSYRLGGFHLIDHLIYVFQDYPHRPFPLFLPGHRVARPISYLQEIATSGWPGEQRWTL